MKTISTDKINKRIEAIRAKREELKAISQPFRALVKQGAMYTINDGLRGIYAEQGHTTLKTLKQWNKDGYQVKKGEHAFLLWGSPISRTQKEEKKEGEDSESDFFPVCFVFSQNQVKQR